MPFEAGSLEPLRRQPVLVALLVGDELAEDEKAPVGLPGAHEATSQPHPGRIELPIELPATSRSPLWG